MAQISMDLDKLKKDFVEKPADEGRNAEDVKAYLKEIYGADPVYPEADATNFAIIKAQAQKICDIVSEKHGLTKFPDLMDKFKSLEHGATYLGNQKAMKESMETILYSIEKESKMSKDELVREFGDREFICGPGTLTNLQEILREISLAGMGLDAYVIEQKRHSLTQIATKLKSEQKFPEFSILHYGRIDLYESMEIHDVSSLVNIMAGDYSLMPKDSKEDPYLTDLESISDESKEIMKNAAQEVLSSPEGINAFIDDLARKLSANLPKFRKNDGQDIREASNNYRGDLSEALKMMNINILFESLIKKDELGNVLGLKDNVDSIMRDAALIALQEKGLVVDPEIEMAKFRLNIETCTDSMSIGHAIDSDLLEEAKEKGKLEYTIEYAVKNNIPIDDDDLGKLSAFEYARQKEIQIDGRSPLEYAVRKGLKIGPEPALLMAQREGQRIDDLDPFHFTIKEGISIEGKHPIIYCLENSIAIEGQENALKYAIDKQLPVGISALKYAQEIEVVIDDKDPILYAEEKGLNLDGKNPIKFALLNDLEILSEPAFIYANKKNLTFEGMDPIKMLLSEGAKIEGIGPVDYIIENQIRVKDQDPILYAMKEFPRNAKMMAQKVIDENVQIDGRSPLYAFLDMENSELRSFALKRAVNYSPHLFNGEIISYALKNDKKLFPGKNALDVAIKNNIKIEGMNPLEYAINNQDDIKIDGQSPIDYMINKGIKIEGKSLIDYVLEKGIKIDGKDPVEYYILNNKLINGKTALEYASKNEYKVDGKDLIESLVLSDANILLNRPVSIRYRVILAGTKIKGKNPLKYLSDNNLKVGGVDAIKYAIKERFRIDRLGALEYAIDNGKKIDGKDPILYAYSQSSESLKSGNDVDTRYMYHGKPALQHTVDTGKKIEGIDALKYAIDNDLYVKSGTKAIDYAYDKKLKVGEDSLIKYAIDNNLKVRGMPAAEIALRDRVQIDGQNPVLYAVDKGLQIGDKSAADYAEEKGISNPSVEVPSPTTVPSQPAATQPPAEPVIPAAPAPAPSPPPERPAPETRPERPDLRPQPPARAPRESRVLDVIKRSSPDVQADRLSQEYMNLSPVWQEWARNNPIGDLRTSDQLLVSTKIYATLENDETKRASYAARKVVEYVDQYPNPNKDKAYEIMEPLIQDSKKSKIKKNADIILRAATKHKKLPFREKVKKVFDKISMALGITPKETTKIAKSARSAKKKSFKEKIASQRRGLDNKISSVPD